MTKHIVGAALTYNNQLLSSQRSYPPDLAGFWELPGGKIEPGEDPLQALLRELKEELGLEIPAQISPILLPCNESSNQAWPLSQGLDMLVFIIPFNIKPAIELTSSHSEHRWLSSDELFSVSWIPADIPIVKKLFTYLNH